jgi:hypothetical protein
MSITQIAGTIHPIHFIQLSLIHPRWREVVANLFARIFCNLLTANIDICHIFHDESALSQIPKVRRNKI